MCPRNGRTSTSGKFDDGWDVLREKIFARQKKLGVIPKDAELTKRHDEIPAWDDMPAELKPVLARQMEIYAGFLEQTDHEIGRVIDAIDDLGVLDDTLIYYIIGDNGASAEGTPNGCFNEMTTLNGLPGIETTEFLLSKIDDFGTPAPTTTTRSAGRTRLCTPYQWTKQSRLTLGRHAQRHHRALAQRVCRTRARSATSSTTSSMSHRPFWRRRGCPRRHSVNGIQQAPLEGVSMLPHAARRRGARDPRGPVLRDDGQPRHLPPGLDRGHQASDPVDGRSPPPFDARRVGIVRARTTGRRRTTWRPRTRRNWLSCNGFG